MKEALKIIVYMILCGLTGGILAGNGIHVNTWEFWAILLPIEILLVVVFKSA